MASGKKWFETQAYRNKCTNLFLDVAAHDIVFFGPSGSHAVDGAFMASEARRGPMRVHQKVAHEHLHERLSHELMKPLQKYLAKKGFMEYVLFDDVWDLRPLKLTFFNLAQLLDSRLPGQWAGMPSLRSHNQELHSLIKQLLADPQTIHRKAVLVFNRLESYCSFRAQRFKG
jgi:hypothetical protein